MSGATSSVGTGSGACRLVCASLCSSRGRAHVPRAQSPRFCTVSPVGPGSPVTLHAPISSIYGYGGCGRASLNVRRCCARELMPSKLRKLELPLLVLMSLTADGTPEHKQGSAVMDLSCLMEHSRKY